MTFSELLIKANGGQARGALEAFQRKLKVVNRSAISHWNSGRSLPSEKLRPQIAMELGVTVEQLMLSLEEGRRRRRETADSKHITQAAHIPVLGTANAENFFFSPDAIADETIPVPAFKGYRTFALKICGDWLEPSAHDGEYLVLVATRHFENGRLALLSANGMHTLKRLFRTTRDIELRPENPKHPTVRTAPDKLQIEGLVIGVWRRV